MRTLERRHHLYLTILVAVWAVLAPFAILDRVEAADEKVPPARNADAYECRWAFAPPEIDGSADDKAWASAQTLDRFTLPWLGKDGRAARTATRAKLLWDREYLYFLADMDDSDLHAEIKDHDGTLWIHDVFELFFKPARDKTGYYEFEFNPAGAWFDMFIPSREKFDFLRSVGDGDFDIKAAVKLRGTLNERKDKDKGWTVEGRIAWKSFLRTGGRPEPGESWTFTLCRVDDSTEFEKQELSVTAPLGGGKPDFHRNQDYAPMRFVGPGQSPRPQSAAAPALDHLAPLTTSRVVGSPEPPDPYRAVKAYPDLKVRYPVAIASQPGSDRFLMITEEQSYGPTKIVRLTDDPKASSVERLMDVDGVAYDFAFHPRFAENGHFYIGLNGPAEGKEKKTKVVRYRMDPTPPYALDVASATTIIEWDSDGHNGGAIDFGPDGMLYVSSGDGTSDSDRWLSGQDLSRRLAKVMRIDVDHPDAGKQYSVPKDNPFVGQAGVVPETWAYGLRNPWRMEFDHKTGQLWLAQNGQDLYEQVYLIQKGANYGWSANEGSRPFYPERHRGVAISPPTAEHHHSEARSLTGGIVYRGDQPAGANDSYVYGDYSTGKIWAIRHDGTKVTFHKELADTTLHITGFATNARGELIVLDHAPDGGIYKLVPAPQNTDHLSFPRKLSESGLFKSVRDHAVQDGVLPYSVNAELWSDGAYKERFLAIPSKPGVERRITFNTTNGFEFPDETVLIKSFALEREVGKPDSRRWIETRFMTKQEGEWVGYSYAWNDDGTDATLVGAEGMDKTFEARDPKASGGTRRQTWHYPSRSECMVCHSRAANFVLGPSLLQFNRDYDYGGGHVENQLAVLERLGLLKVDYAAEAQQAVRREGARKGLEEKALDDYARKQTEAPDQRQPRESSLLYKPPADYEKLVNPHDTTASLDARARSYLHANCYICHVEAGGGNAAIDLGFMTSRGAAKVFDVVPLHDRFGLADARIVATGAPERSVLLHRISVRGPGQMPPIATSVVDERAVALIRNWIAASKPVEPPR
jgi:glucose/arabinose dehydrogenase